jgi:REP element-mobilizing transposase RayT
MNDHARHGHLPRLAPEYYRGLAVVHWVMTVDDRRTGWLTPHFHAQRREALLHTMVRYSLLSPAYCLMPDHAHFIWMGVDTAADLALAAEFFRRQTNLLLSPMSWQKSVTITSCTNLSACAVPSAASAVTSWRIRCERDWSRTGLSGRFQARPCRGIPM